MTDTTAGEAKYTVRGDRSGKLQIYSAKFNAKVAEFCVGIPETQRREIGKLLAAQPSAGAQNEWPEKWSGPCTVGNMIANLKTLPPEMPLYTAYHVTFDDGYGPKSLCKVKRPTMSRERVDGTNIKTCDDTIPYSAVIWANPQNVTAQPDTGDVAALRSGVYVASRASIPERGQMWRDVRSSGVKVNSTWIDEDGPKASRDLSGLWVRINREVTTSERLILYVEPSDFPLKGAFIEVGMALAANVPIVIVAPDVTLEERNCRPLGSWIKHPLVSFAPTIDAALSKPNAPGRDG